MNPTPSKPVGLTSLSHGGGCGCKIAPGVLSEILKGSSGFPLPPELLVGIDTADDAAVDRLNGTGASNRNWESYGAAITLPAGFASIDRALLTDPQTSGGLLGACAADVVPDVLANFRREGFADAAVIGAVEAGAARVSIA